MSNGAKKIVVVIDPVESILNGLPRNHGSQFQCKERRSAIARQTNEGLRLLKSKLLGGRLGKNDSEASRAALVLDYVIRKGGDACPIPLDVLARAAGRKKRDLELLQPTVEVKLADLGRRLGGPQLARRTASAARSRSDSTTPTSAASADRNYGADRLGEVSTIRHLSFGLGPLVPDADGAASRGEEIFRSISSNADRGLARDMQIYRDAYEAACFYVAAKESEGRAAPARVRRPKRRADADQPSGSSGNEEEDVFEDDEEEERVLRVSDVVEASSLVESTFKKVLGFVAKHAEGVKKESSNSFKTTERKQKGAASAHRGGKQRKRQRYNRGGQEKQVFGGVGGESCTEKDSIKTWSNPSAINHISFGGVNEVGRDSCDIKAPDGAEEASSYVPSEEFKKWEEDVLMRAKQSAAKELGDLGARISEDDVLNRAANDVMMRWRQKQ